MLTRMERCPPVTRSAGQHVRIVFPLWHGTMPALLKAFIEQVMRPGVALQYQKEGFPRRLLAGHSAHVVVTVGMPALIYRWYFRAHGVCGLERSVLRFSGMKPVRETLFGMVQRSMTLGVGGGCIVDLASSHCPPHAALPWS
jgi:putative NADPH-quinone reductase